MNVLTELMTDLESAVQEGQQERRIEVLRKVTDLFLAGADQFKEEHVGVFDNVLMRLTDQLESQALAELSGRLAPVDMAPRAVVQRLARHDEIAIAGPVLAQSARLTDEDLMEIAKSKGQMHLGAISERSRLAAAVTDILVERGDTAVVRKLSSNQGAAFSDAGFNTLATRAQSDDQLAVNLGSRVDVPPKVLQTLVAKATEEVRARLLRGTPPERRAEIEKAVNAASNQVSRNASAPLDFRRAERLLAEMQELGQLDESTVVKFAHAGQYEEMVVALAMLCGSQVDLIEPLVRNPAYDGLLLACKACGIHWTTFSAILAKRFPSHPISGTELDKARADFLNTSAATAKRVFRFWLVRSTAQKH